MSGNLYSWFGYIQNNSTGQTSGVFGPLTADLDAAGFNIVNVGLLSSGDISTGGLTVNGCATGPGACSRFVIRWTQKIWLLSDR